MQIITRGLTRVELALFTKIVLRSGFGEDNASQDIARAITLLAELESKMREEK